MHTIFEAIALSDKFPRGRKPGTIEIINGALCFKDRDNNIHGLPLQGGKVTIGAGNRYIYFTHPSYPELTFYTDDREILKMPDIKFDQRHANIGRNMRNKHRLVMATIYTILGIIVAAILSLFILRGALVEHIASYI
jgi:beta-barrel assembly-enhancing protease